MKLRYKILILVCALVISLRLFLPLGIRYAMNQYLSENLQNYSARIEDFGLSLYKGSYEIQGLRVWQKDRADYDPLLVVDKIEVTVLSHLLLERKFLSSLEITNAKLYLIDSAIKGNQQFGESNEWDQVVQKILPLNLESVKISDSTLTFLNKDYKRPVQISIDKIFISAINIHNTENVQRKLPSQVNFSARVQRDGWIRGNAQFDISKSVPDLNLKVGLTSLNLRKLNNAFILYGPFYFLNGEMTLYSQVFLNEGNIRGYLTPFFKNVEPVKIIWNNRIARSYVSDSIQALGGLVLGASMKKAQGRRYTFSGQMISAQQPWSSFWSAVRNGFNKPIQKPPSNSKKKNNLADKERDSTTTLR